MRYSNCQQTRRRMLYTLSQQENETTWRYYYKPTKMVSITKLPVPDTGEDLKQLEFSNTVCNNAKWYNHLEYILAVSYKVKHMLIGSSNSIPRYLSKRSESLHLCKVLYVNVHSFFFLMTPN